MQPLIVQGPVNHGAQSRVKMAKKETIMLDQRNNKYIKILAEIASDMRKPEDGK